MEQPPPDTKDWTWILDRPCPQCGYRAEAVDREQIGPQMRANAAGFRTALGRGDIVHRRPPVPPGEPPVWSALEYAAHVADVYEMAGERLTRMIRKRNPSFADWDQNHAAIQGRYAELEPDKLSYRLAVSAGKMADLVDKVGDGQWERTGTRSDGVRFTIDGFARYILHDVTHHLWDVERGYQAIRKADGGKPDGGDAAGREEED